MTMRHGISRRLKAIERRAQPDQEAAMWAAILRAVDGKTRGIPSQPATSAPLKIQAENRMEVPA
jgi:hypothetical protein